MKLRKELASALGDGLEAKDKKDTEFELESLKTYDGLKFCFPQNAKFSNGTNTQMRIVAVDAAEKEHAINASTEEIKKLIDETDDVKKVVIEQLTDKNATRVSFLFDLDAKINKELGDILSKNHVEQNPRSTPARSHCDVVRSIESKINDSFVPPSIESKLPRSTQEKMIEDNVLSLPPKGEERDAVFTKGVFKRKKKKATSKYYYKAKNHLDLFKMGNSFYNDYKKGIRSFGFNCQGLPQARQKTVFGVCSFFNYHSDAKVTIVTYKISECFYFQYAKSLQKVENTTPDGNFTYPAYCEDNLEIIDYDELLEAYRQQKNIPIEEFLHEFVRHCDVILWDLPTIRQMDELREIFYPLIHIMDSVSFIISENNSSGEELTGMMDYYEKYEVRVKGVILERTHSPLKNSK